MTRSPGPARGRDLRCHRLRALRALTIVPGPICARSRLRRPRGRRCAAGRRRLFFAAAWPCSGWLCSRSRRRPDGGGPNRVRCAPLLDGLAGSFLALALAAAGWIALEREEAHGGGPAAPNAAGQSSEPSLSPSRPSR
jgi:hypothetical protein